MAEDLDAAVAEEATGSEQTEQVAESKPVESQTQTQEPTPDIEPTWLDEVRSYGSGTQQQQQYYEPPQQQYQQQQYQQPRQAPTDLDALLENPRDYIARVMQEGMTQYGRQQQTTQQQLWMIQQANVKNSVGSADRAIQRGYQEVLNRDDSFKGNEKVRGLVEGTLRTMRTQAEQQAWYGNPEASRVFDNPKFFPALVAAAKVAAGVSSVSPSPAQPRGATSGRVTQRAEEGGYVELPPDLEEVARTLGDGYRQKLEKEYAASVKRGDVDF